MFILGLLLFAWCFIGVVCFLNSEKKDLNDKQVCFIIAIAGPVIWVVTVIGACFVCGVDMVNKVLDKLK